MCGMAGWVVGMCGMAGWVVGMSGMAGWVVGMRGMAGGVGGLFRWVFVFSFLFFPPSLPTPSPPELILELLLIGLTFLVCFL